MPSRKPAGKSSKPVPSSPAPPPGASRPLSGPVFAQPVPTADPKRFKVKHPSDDPTYKEIDELNREHKIQPLPFPPPRGLPEPRLTLQEVFGGSATPISNIEASGQ